MVKHGSMDLHWCDTCSVPLVMRGQCPSCGARARGVAYTPPGDIRPAFPFDIIQFRKLADDQWGGGAGLLLFPNEGPYLINPSPSPDRMDEIIVDGGVLANIAFFPLKLGSYLLPRESAFRVMGSSSFRPERGFVRADAVAARAVIEGKSLLSPGIVEAYPGIKVGDEVLVLDVESRVIGSGIAKKEGKDLVGTRGMGIKVRWVIDPERKISQGPSPFKDQPHKEIWKRVVEVNAPHIQVKVDRSIDFIKAITASSDLPQAVSFSGGKDSLATLLLVLASGLRPKVLFVDTGIEFPETVEYVRSLMTELGLSLLQGRPRSDFFEDMRRFGPPGRDFRWCCKTLKLGPTNALIEENFPAGVLSFIGQRRFESDIREQKGSTWRNPWVPKQQSASPVQDWTALDVWSYIFREGARYNPLYENGFGRIGCWLCPSSDLSELELIGRTSADKDRFGTALEAERIKRGLPEEWVRFGFHRFKRMPPHMVRLREELGLPPEVLMDKAQSRQDEDRPSLELVPGTGTCIDGLSREGVINLMLETGRLSMLLNIIGSVRAMDGVPGYDVLPPDWNMRRPAIELYDDGTVLLRGKDERSIRELERKLISVLKRHSGCVGCGICLGMCPSSALSLAEDGKVALDASRCVHCGSCLGPCPAEAFDSDPY